MSTSLKAVFNVISGIVYLVIVNFSIHGRKMRFSESCQFSISEKSIFGQFEVILLNVCIFLTAGLVIPVNTFKEKYFDEKMSSLTDLKKIINFPRKFRFWPFLTTWVHFQSRFSRRRGKHFEKSLKGLLGEVVRNIMLIFELSMFSDLLGGGVAVLPVDIFRKI